MNANHYLTELTIRTGIKKTVWILLILSLVTNFVLALGMVFTKHTERTIVIPPHIQRSVWFENEKVSKEYLEEMGVFIAQLLLNTTPQTVEKQHGDLLKYVAPNYYQALQKELALSAKYIKQNNFGTWFVPRRVVGYEHNNTVEIEGQFQVAQNDKVTERSQRKLLITFNYENGKVMLTGIKEEVRQTRQAKPKANVETVASEPVIASNQEAELVDFRSE